MTVLDVAVYTVSVPVVIGVGAFGLLAVALGVVWSIGKARPHS